MKNRYCLYCGTLLPEDSVCLRCGAKYEIADDGQMIVTPRKVKTVVAKPQKKITAKKADLSQAETQTIPIPEDVFSFSDDTKHVKERTENDYMPNYVLKDGPERVDQFNAERQKQKTAPKTATHKNKEVHQASVNGKTLIAVFLVMGILSSVVTCLFLKSRFSGYPNNNPSVSSEETNSKELQISGDSQALYAEVLNAYKEFEKNAYRPSSNKYVDEGISYGEPGVYDYWNYSWIRLNERLAYAFWDINDDGVEELFIGRTDDFGDYFDVLDVYTYTNEPSRVFPEFGFAGIGPIMHFYEDGSMAETPEQQDGPADKRVKEQGYTFYELRTGAATASKTKSYWIDYTQDASGVEHFKAFKEENNARVEIPVEEYGEIDDMYGGSWLESSPMYSSKWDENNEVLKEKQFKWDYLIKNATTSSLSNDNKKAVAAYKDMVYSLFFDMNTWYGDETEELDELKRYINETLDIEDEDQITAFANYLEFAVCDVNNDNVLDFAIRSRLGPTVSHISYLFNYLGDKYKIVKVLEGYDFEYYSNGDVSVLWSHNHTRGELWPREYYHQENPKQAYIEFGHVYAWNNDIVDDGFPANKDNNGNGIVYTFDDEKSWVDDKDYQSWMKQHGVESPKQFDWHAFTMDNVRQFESIAAKAAE